MTDVAVITIDGPSGSGKGTAAQLLAQRLQWHYLDSGALYRAFAIAARQRGLNENHCHELEQLARKIKVDFQSSQLGDRARIILEGVDISQQITHEWVGGLASQLSTLPSIRQALLQQQRSFRQSPGLVTDGRDMGTVVFPDATLKFFLSASPQQRACRRYHQLRQQGIDANLENIERELCERDQRDRQRTVSPLVAADNAISIDSSHLTIDAVMSIIVSEVEQHLTK